MNAPSRYPRPGRHADALFVQAASLRGLTVAAQQLRDRGGAAPGCDGLRFTDLRERELKALLDNLSNRLRTGNYRPVPRRSVSIPKTSGGQRTLRIPALFDRIIEKSVSNVLAPLLDPLFRPESVGYRRERGAADVWADLSVNVPPTESWFLTTADVKQAFDHVPVEDVLADLQRHVRSDRLLSLLEVILRGHEGKEIGLDQGSPLSPLLMNLRLHGLDVQLAQSPAAPLWRRYADNFVFATRSASEGQQMIRLVGAWLTSAGLSLKDDHQTVNLLRSGTSVEVLGLVLARRSNRLAFRIPDRRWCGLRERLESAWYGQTPSFLAQAIVRGWIASLGPTFEKAREQTTVRIHGVAGTAGFHELGSVTVIRQWIDQSYSQWTRTLEDAQVRRRWTTVVSMGSIRQHTGAPRLQLQRQNPSP